MMPLFIAFIAFLFAVVGLLVTDIILAAVVWRLTGRVGPISFVLYGLRNRRRRVLPLTQSILTHLAAATRMNLPLAPAMKLAARSEGGWLRSCLNSVSSWISAGLPLSEALFQSIPSCPSFVVSLVRAGEASGQTSRSLDVAANMLEDRISRSQSAMQSYWVYPMFLVVSLWLILTMIMVSVIPKFEEIFCDFGIPLPDITCSLVEASRWFVSGTPPGYFGVLLLLLVVFLFLVISALPRHPESPGPAFRLIDSLRWWTPVMHDIDRGEGTAAAIETIKMALVAGMPLESAVKLAGNIDVNHHVAARFRTLGKLLGEGVTPDEAAKRAGLGTVLAGAFGAIVRCSSYEAMLDHAAEFHRATARRWWHWLARFIWPLTTLVSGFLVCYVMLALFTPVIALIDSLTVYPGAL